MRKLTCLLALALTFAVGACPSSTPTTTTTSSATETPPPTPTPPTATPPDAVPMASPTGPGRGENCAPDDTCAAGLECVKYYGIAGARGPQFKTCETKCDGGKACPDGTKCITIADGPGQVCR